MTSKPKIYTILIAMIFIWGLSWSINKIGLNFMPPLWFAAFRLLIGTVAMFFIALCLGKLVWPTKADLKLIFVLGLLQVGLFMVLINAGLFYVGAGRSAMLVYTTPIWVVPISIIVFKEKPGPLKWAGFSLGVLGITLLFSPWELNWSNHQVLIGNGFLLLAALCWAIAILCARYMHWSRAPIELIFWQLLVGTLPVLFFVMIVAPAPVIIWNFQLIVTLIFSGVFATAFAYWGSITVSKELPPITTSLSFLAVPVCSLIFAWILLHEPISTLTQIAMALILLGLVCLGFDKGVNRSASFKESPYFPDLGDKK